MLLHQIGDSRGNHKKELDFNPEKMACECKRLAPSILRKKKRSSAVPHDKLLGDMASKKEETLTILMEINSRLTFKH
ncbi:hypothetical protein TNCV_800041 [Trichonephila clavipes]|nr:hypothetical protein TNCV_800041 [Trichonephila clavipes]